MRVREHAEGEKGKVRGSGSYICIIAFIFIFITSEGGDNILVNFLCGEKG